MLHNAVITLLAECTPIKMHMYTEKDVLGWIDAELDNEAHNEMLVLGEAEVEGWVTEHDKLFHKKKKVPPMPEDQPPASKKRKSSNLLYLEFIYFRKACGGIWVI